MKNIVETSIHMLFEDELRIHKGRHC